MIMNVYFIIHLNYFKKLETRVLLICDLGPYSVQLSRRTKIKRNL